MSENFWLNTCRLCIEKKTQFIDVDGSEELSNFISVLLQEFFQITIDASEDLPKELCFECFQKMSVFYEFRQQVFENQSTLQQHHLSGTLDVLLRNGYDECSEVVDNAEKVEYTEEELIESSSGEYMEVCEELEEVHVEEEAIAEELEECALDMEIESKHEIIEALDEYVHESAEKEDTEEKSVETPQITLKSEEIEVLDEYLYGRKEEKSFDVPAKRPHRRESAGRKKKDAIILKYFPEFEEIKCPSRKMDPKEKEELIAEFVKLECLECEDHPIFPDFEMLQLHHHRKNHPGKGYVVCCEKQFTKKNDLISHIINHSHPDAFTCPAPECMKAMKSKSHLRSHMYTHLPNDERPMQCEECGKRFLAATQLKAHMNSHMPPGQKYIDKNTRAIVMGSVIHDKPAEQTDDVEIALPYENHRQKSENLILKHFPQFEFIQSATSGMTLEEKDDLIGKYVKLECKECENNPHFADFDTLAQHYYDNHTGIRGSAECCGKIFYQRISLLNHVALHEKPDAFACFVCSKCMRSKEMLKNHLYCHLPRSARPLKCDICEKQFYTKCFLKDHMVTHLSENQWEFECDECGRKFSQKGLLKRHKKIHAREMDHVCEICSKAFIGKTNYDNHKMRHHEPVKPVTCPVCGGQYKNHASLRAHMVLHTDSREHTCPTCDKTYTTKAGLQAHIRYVHSGVARYKCSYCAKKFKTTTDLKEHSAKHQGGVIHQCPFCPKFFHTRSYFFSHRKKAHPVEYAMLKQKPRYAETTEEN